MLTPAEQHARAATEVETLSLVITRGGPVSPDLVMQMVTATRERLNRHQPNRMNRFSWTCAYDGETWPCANVRGDLKVFGPGDDEDGQ